MSNKHVHPAIQDVLKRANVFPPMKILCYQKSHCELPDFETIWFIAEGIRPVNCKYCKDPIEWEDLLCGQCSGCGMQFDIED
jgi:hypothetical protein